MPHNGVCEHHPHVILKRYLGKTNIQLILHVWSASVNNELAKETLRQVYGIEQANGMQKL